jgi:hypothetical protein
MIKIEIFNCWKIKYTFMHILISFFSIGFSRFKILFQTNRQEDKNLYLYLNAGAFFLFFFLIYFTSKSLMINHSAFMLFS